MKAEYSVVTSCVAEEYLITVKTKEGYIGYYMNKDIFDDKDIQEILIEAIMKGFDIGPILGAASPLIRNLAACYIDDTA